MDEFYGTAQGAKDYFTLRGVMLPPRWEDDDDITGDLLVASEWLDGKYQPLFPGLKVGLRDQVREWPRVGANDIYGYYLPSDAVPREMINATYEAAIRQGRNPGSLTIDFTPGKYKRVSVDGAISVDYTQFTWAADVQTQIAIVEAILYPILTGNSGNFSMLSGASVRT